MGVAVGLTERVTRRLIESPVPFEPASLWRAARSILDEEAPLAGPETVQEVIDLLVGLGPLEPLLRQAGVTDVLVNGPGEVWVERFGTMELTEVRFPDAEAAVAAAERVIAPLGLRLDRSSPAVSARLPDGSRLSAAIPPIVVGGPVLAVRRFVQPVEDLGGLVKTGSLDEDRAAFLAESVRLRRNVLVSGGTGSGKTTLLNILSGEIPATERVVTVEDAAELRLSGHVVRLEARPPNAEGAGEVTLRELMRHALRLRPDRIVLGEVRGPEAVEMVTAMNTGHAGSMCTIHANSPDEALWRLETLAMAGQGQFGELALRRQLHSAIDLIVQLERVGTERRVGIVALVRPDGSTEVAIP